MVEPKPPAAPEICISEEAAKTLGVQPGSITRWTISGRELSARVACIHRIDEIHLASRVEFIFSTGALDGFPVIYYGALRVQPPAVPALQQALYDRYPTITVVNMADVLQTFQGVVDQIALVIRFISMFAILAGAIILSSSVAGTRFRRMREVVILKTLGATRWRVSRIFSVEFLILGAVAGTMGALLANGFANLLLKRHAGFRNLIPAPAQPAGDCRHRANRKRRRLDGQLPHPGPKAPRNPPRRINGEKGDTCPRRNSRQT